MLGEILQCGGGVKPDLVQSWMWLNLAVSSGYAEAQETLAKVASKLSPEELKEAQTRCRNFVPRPPSEAHRFVYVPMH